MSDGEIGGRTAAQSGNGRPMIEARPAGVASPVDKAGHGQLSIS